MTPMKDEDIVESLAENHTRGGGYGGERLQHQHRHRDWHSHQRRRCIYCLHQHYFEVMNISIHQSEY
jgi:hypothetical protein